MMWILMSAVLVLMVGGLLAWLAGRHVRLAAHCGAGAAVVGSLLTLFVAADVLVRVQSAVWPWAWRIPFGTFALEVDALSAVFLLPMALVVAAGAIYGHAYFGHACRPDRVGTAWCFFNLLAASMLLVVTARNSWLFLMCWEVMTLTSFFLVLTHHEQETSRRAAVLYLAAMHVGTSCLLVLFVWLGQSSGSLDWRGYVCEPRLAGAAFVLAMIGFGTKAGFVPLHIWLPEAHPAAPSPVSAVMSGVMIKTGVYGLLRTVTFLGPVAPWWGWTLVVVGVVGGLFGVLLALAQQDVKRLLAYSSVENMGIITLGLGVGLLGLAYEVPGMAFLGLAGGLLHVLNHALFKSLLFLGAGAIQTGTASRRLDQLGGLWKTMPVTGVTFLIAACAISGLPPLNGFVGEVLIYLGAFGSLTGETTREGGLGVAMCVFVVGGLALIGGLCAACFANAFGCVFLGEPRSVAARHAHEVPRAMRGAMVALAVTCLCVALTAPLWPHVYYPACAVVADAGGATWKYVIPGMPTPGVVGVERSEPPERRSLGAQVVRPQAPGDSQSGAHPLRFPTRLGSTGLDTAHAVLAIVCGMFWLLLAGLAGLAWWRARLLTGRVVARAPTWDCGYAVPSPRMQYTASSFANPIVQLFRLVIQTRTQVEGPAGFFPRRARFASHAPDIAYEYLVRPVVSGITRAAARLRWFQGGRLQLYVLYIALTILVLFVWKLR